MHQHAKISSSHQLNLKIQSILGHVTRLATAISDHAHPKISALAISVILGLSNNFMQKIRIKSMIANSEIMRCERTDGQCQIH